jgi:hypothetical protein
MGWTDNYYTIMSTITKTNFGQVIFITIIISVGSKCLGCGNMPRDVTSQMEKDKYLQEMIRSTYFAYAWKLKMAWDVKTWDWKSIKASRTIIDSCIRFLWI